MTVYTIYLPPEGHEENSHDEFRLVPDAKAKLALFFPPLWLAWNKLWLPLMVYLVVTVAILLIGVSGSYIAASYLSILPGLYLLLEGYQLIRQRLENSGWRYVGIVEAEDQEEAEIRFLLEQDASSSPSIKPEYSRGSYIMPATKPGSQTMSLFPE